MEPTVALLRFEDQGGWAPLGPLSPQPQPSPAATARAHVSKGVWACHELAPGAVSAGHVIARNLGKLGKWLCPFTVKMNGSEGRGRKHQRQRRLQRDEEMRKGERAS